jgi:hypothetical protein
VQRRVGRGTKASNVTGVRWYLGFNKRNRDHECYASTC